MKSVKEANWGCGGAFFVLLSIAILIIYFVTGGLPAKGGRILKSEYSGVCAFLMSALFFLMGVLSIGVWVLRKLKGNAAGRDVSRWRRF